MKGAPILLVLGDPAALAAVTLVGFATHGELGSASPGRILATFLPLVLSWFLLAPWFGLFAPLSPSRLRQLWWRVPLAMIAVGPLAALLRALMLGSVVIPVFAAVLAGSGALGMLVWRLLAAVLLARRGLSAG